MPSLTSGSLFPQNRSSAASYRVRRYGGALRLRADAGPFSSVIPLIKRESTGSRKGGPSRGGVAIHPDLVSGPLPEYSGTLRSRPGRRSRIPDVGDIAPSPVRYPDVS